MKRFRICFVICSFHSILLDNRILLLFSRSYSDTILFYLFILFLLNLEQIHFRFESFSSCEIQSNKATEELLSNKRLGLWDEWWLQRGRFLKQHFNIASLAHHHHHVLIFLVDFSHCDSFLSFCAWHHVDGFRLHEFTLHMTFARFVCHWRNTSK